MSRKDKSGFSGTGSGVERTDHVSESKYSGYAKTLARESNQIMANDNEDRWLMYKNTTQNGESFVRYSLEDNYIAGIGSTTQGAGATELFVSALKDIQRYGDENSPVEWMVSSSSADSYYKHLGLAKYKHADTYSIPLSDLPKVINKLEKRTSK